MDFIMLTSNESFSELHEEDSFAHERATATNFALVHEFSEDSGPSGYMGGKLLKPKFMKAFTNEDSDGREGKQSQTLLANRSPFGTSQTQTTQPKTPKEKILLEEIEDSQSEEEKEKHQSAKEHSRRQGDREWNASFGQAKTTAGGRLGELGAVTQQGRPVATGESSIQIIRSVTPIFSMRALQTPSPTSQTEKSS